jgi:hypothetical protein
VRTPTIRILGSIPASAFRPALLCILAFPAFSQNATTNEFWPEVDVYLPVHSNVRLILSAKKERDTDVRSSEVGANIEWSLHRFPPILGVPWVDQDATRRTLISFRAGYLYKRSYDQTPPVHENRPQVEFTLRWVFLGNVVVSNRARWEFRFVQGSAFSWRYRDQLKFEKDLKLHGYTFTCYIAAEPFYNSAKSSWDRFRFSGGTVLPIVKWLAVEPYYLRQIVTDSQPRYTNALGLVAHVHVGK